MLSIWRLALSGALMACLGGCTTAQWYAAGQAWQRQHCQAVNVEAERQRCLASAGNADFPAYQSAVQESGLGPEAAEAR